MAAKGEQSSPSAPKNPSVFNQLTEQYFMKRFNTKSPLSTLLAGSLFLVSGLASAGICDAEYQNLRADINLAASLSDRNAAGLDEKALASQSKANEGKITDAKLKLDDIQSAMTLWLTATGKAKISTEDYNLLTNDVTATKACLALVQ